MAFVTRRRTMYHIIPGQAVPVYTDPVPPSTSQYRLLLTQHLHVSLIREVCGKSKWKFKMAFAIRRPTPPPLMAKFPDIFLPHFFSFAIESYIYETDFTLQKYHF